VGVGGTADGVGVVDGIRVGGSGVGIIGVIVGVGSEATNNVGVGKAASVIATNEA